MQLEHIDTRKIFIVSALVGIFIGAGVWYWQNSWSRPGSVFRDVISAIQDFSSVNLSAEPSVRQIPADDFSAEFISREEFVSRTKENPVDELRKIWNR